MQPLPFFLLLLACGNPAPPPAAELAVPPAEVLQRRYGSLRAADEPVGWLPATEPLLGNYVFRGKQYGRPMLGCFEMHYTSPGGELRVRLLNLVDEGQVLEVR